MLIAPIHTANQPVPGKEVHLLLVVDPTTDLVSQSELVRCRVQVLVIFLIDASIIAMIAYRPSTTPCVCLCLVSKLSAKPDSDNFRFIIVDQGFCGRYCNFKVRLPSAAASLVGVVPKSRLMTSTLKFGNGKNMIFAVIPSLPRLRAPEMSIYTLP